MSIIIPLAEIKMRLKWPNTAPDFVSSQIALRRETLKTLTDQFHIDLLTNELTELEQLS